MSRTRVESGVTKIGPKQSGRVEDGSAFSRGLKESAMRQVGDFFRHRKSFLLILLASFCLAACAHQPSVPPHQPPGFLLGLFQGFTMLFSFVGSIFFDVRIYAFPNAGFYYDLGYVIGAGCFFGGLGRSR